MSSSSAHGSVVSTTQGTYSPSPEELAEETIKARFQLPKRKQGMGLVSTVEVAKASYIGTIHDLSGRLREWFPNLRVEDFPGLKEGHAALRGLLEANGGSSAVLPSLQVIVEGHPIGDSPTLPDELDEDVRGVESSGEATKGKREREKKLGWRLKEALFTAKRTRLNGGGTGLKNFALVQTSTVTASDFLSLPFQNQWTRVSCPHLILAVRTYLGLPTTNDACWIDTCGGREVTPFGAHSHHVRGACQSRHDELRDDLYRFFLTVAPGLATHEVERERFMEETYGLREGEQKDGTGEKFDLALTKVSTGHKTVMDVVVSHPVFSAHPEGWRADGAVESAARHKHDVYAKWNVNKRDVVPLSFSTYNAWGKQAFAYLKTLAKECTGSERMAAVVFRAVRLVVARAIVRGQGRLLTELNRRNGTRRFNLRAG